MKKVFIDDLFDKVFKTGKLDFALFYDGGSLDEYYGWYSAKILQFAGRPVLLMGFYGGIIESYALPTYDEIVSNKAKDEITDELFEGIDASIGNYCVNQYFNKYIRMKYPQIEYVYVEEFENDGHSVEMRQLNQSIIG